MKMSRHHSAGESQSTLDSTCSQASQVSLNEGYPNNPTWPTLARQSEFLRGIYTYVQATYVADAEYHQ